MSTEQPDQHNPYDFITNPSQPGKPGKVGLGTATSTQKKIAIVAGGVVLLIILFAVVSTIISNASKGNYPQMLIAIQDQDELAHIASQSTNQATNAATKNIAVTVQITMASAQNDLVANLAKHGHKVTKELATAGESPSIDGQLKSAESVSNFDSTFLQILQTKLSKYQVDLRAAAVGATAAQTNLLKNDYNGAGLLLSQVKAAITSIGQ